MASFDQSWKISLRRSVFAFGGLKLLRLHFGNLLAMMVVWTSALESDTLKTKVHLMTHLFIHPLIYIYMYSSNIHLLNVHSARSERLTDPLPTPSCPQRTPTAVKWRVL